MDNPELGRKVLDVIDMHPERLKMGHWGRQEPCGTTACLAGWTMLCAGYTYHARSGYFHRLDGSRVSYEDYEAEKLLGLDSDEVGVEDGEIWFDYAHGPDRFRKIVEESEGQAQQ